MKQAILDHRGISIVESSVPEYSDRQILVKTISCGVCSGDLHLYQARQSLDAPAELGHEITGRIEKLGKNVTGFEVGDIVTSVDGTGGYADYVVEDQSFFTRVPDNVPQEAALGEPIACCVHAMNRVSIGKGTSVALVGCGFMGLICLQIAKARGAGKICAFDPVEQRRQLASELGATQTENSIDYLIEDPDQGEFDLVIEATGVQPALSFCSDLVNHHGQLLIIGYHQSGDGTREVNLQRWNYKAMDVINGHVRHMDQKHRAMEEGMALYQQGLIDMRPLTQYYSLTDIDQAFNDLDIRKEGLIKAVIRS